MRGLSTLEQVGVLVTALRMSIAACLCLFADSLQSAPEQPGADGEGEPCQSSEDENKHLWRAGKPYPEDESEGDEAGATEGGAESIESGDQASAVGAIGPDAAFVNFFVCFDEAGSGGEDCREREEQAADSGTVPVCDETGGNADCAAKDKANDPLVGPDAFDCGEARMDDHFATHQRPSETANQMGSSIVVATSAGGLQRRSIQFEARA